jgi:hypothetical protein
VLEQTLPVVLTHELTPEHAPAGLSVAHVARDQPAKLLGQLVVVQQRADGLVEGLRVVVKPAEAGILELEVLADLLAVEDLDHLAADLTPDRELDEVVRDAVHAAGLLDGLDELLERVDCQVQTREHAPRAQQDAVAAPDLHVPPAVVHPRLLAVGGDQAVHSVRVASLDPSVVEHGPAVAADAHRLQRSSALLLHVVHDGLLQPRSVHGLHATTSAWRHQVPCTKSGGGGHLLFF